MFHNPYGDNTGLTTNELVCALVGRIDASDSLLALLALMVGMSDELPIDKRYRMACSLRDAAEMVETTYRDKAKPWQ
jgi:hypothetical protein